MRDKLPVRDRGARPVRALFRAHRARRRHQRRDAALDGRASGALRPALGQRAGRHLELRDVRVRPALAHLRPRQDRAAAWSCAGAAPARRLELLNGNTVEVDAQVGVIADARRCRIARRHHGRRRDGGLGRHAQRLCRGRVLVARRGRRPLAPLQLLDRRRPSLRARRRSGDDGRAHRAHHAADRRHLRRRGRADGRPGRGAARAQAREAARRARRQGDRHAGRRRPNAPACSSASACRANAAAKASCGSRRRAGASTSRSRKT